MMAGSADGASRAIRNYIRALNGKGEATVIGTATKFAAQQPRSPTAFKAMFWTMTTPNWLLYLLVHLVSKPTQPHPYWLRLSR